MKIKTISILLALTLLISACSNAPATPEITGEDIQATANVVALTAVAQTLAAVPTETPLPPTETPTQTPSPTNTPEASLTLDPAVASPTLAVLDVPTFTPQPATSGNDPCNKPLTSWQGPTASFTIMNETKPQGTIILLMSVTTPLGECGWLPIYSDSFSGPVGTYSAGAFVDGTKDFKVFGAFQIQQGAWKIVVRNDVIVALGGCYPNC